MADMLDSLQQAKVRGPEIHRIPFVAMSTPTSKTLLEPGHETEWAEINREEDQQRRDEARSLTMAERVRRGEALSKQAVMLLAASMRAGNVPARAFWS